MLTVTLRAHMRTSDTLCSLAKRVAIAVLVRHKVVRKRSLTLSLHTTA